MEKYIIYPKTDWAKIPTLQMLHPLFPSAPGVTAQAQICYDDTALYVRLSAAEHNLRAEHKGLLDEVSEDSCLEFFYSPMGDGRYFNLEVNPNGAMYFGFGTSLQNLYRLIPETHPIQPVIETSDSGWSVEYAIPHDFVKLFFPEFSPAPGKEIRANCFKCGDLTDHPHWLCWSPVPESCATFHCSEYFGTMQFA